MLPNVGSFCYDILKSMLATYEDDDAANIPKANYKNSNRMETDSESSSEEEDEQINSLRIKHQKFSHNKLDKDLVKNTNGNYQRLTNNVLV